VVNVPWTVSEVAGLSHVSVRTLHHYDEIDLVRPAKRSDAGYRLYDHHDLERLQQVLFFREVGFSLEDIRAVLDDPAFDRTEALLVQRELLEDKTERLRAMITTIDTAIEAEQKGIAMDEKDMFEVFGGDDPTRYEDEARERWGDTDAYKESRRRAKSYTKEDWLRIKTDQEAVEDGFATAMSEGFTPDSPEALALAERARLGIDQAFYPCSYQMHANLGRMYIADQRFAKHYDDRKPGLAKYICDALVANAKAHGVDVA
jgi:MerR family transcriptional regulator, thiopeptide resistance regulator